MELLQMEIDEVIHACLEKAIRIIDTENRSYEGDKSRVVMKAESVLIVHNLICAANELVKVVPV